VRASARAALVATAAALAAAGCAIQPVARPIIATTETPTQAGEFLDDIEHRTFQFFWDQANPVNGLVPDRYPTPSFASVAAVGFALSAYPVGVERGYVSRAAARARVLTTLRFLRDAPQGPGVEGMTGFKGFYYHFLDMNSGARWSGQSELSMIDTALLISGVLFCESYFDGKDAAETELRKIADGLYRRVDWAWAARDDGGVALGWSPEMGFHPRNWKGYNEASILYVLGLASPTHPLPAGAWQSYASTFDFSWQNDFGEWRLGFPPLFGHQFSHVWIDFRDIRDAYMRGKNMDFVDNTRKAIYAQRGYAIANPMHWKGYNHLVWGLTACDGPTDVKLSYEGETRNFYSYAARGLGGAHTFDDGTLCPNAILGSLPFTPEIALPALRQIKEKYGAVIYSTYGFLDAFNLSFTYEDVKLKYGRMVPGFGWVDTDYLGIDEGLSIAMIENFRSGLIWKVMRRNPYVRSGLKRAGFSGGWLETSG